MTEDTPEDLTAERANALFFQQDPLARPILGTRESVTAFDRERLLGYRTAHYTPRNTVVACAGHFEEETLLKLLETSSILRRRIWLPPHFGRPIRAAPAQSVCKRTSSRYT